MPPKRSVPGVPYLLISRRKDKHIVVAPFDSRYFVVRPNAAQNNERSPGLRNRLPGLRSGESAYFHIERVAGPGITLRQRFQRPLITQSTVQYARDILINELMEYPGCIAGTIGIVA